MAKDPAVLWYWSDWGGGTKTFTRHLKGCYMDLLDAQFNSGPLSMDEIRTVLGTDFGQAWPTLQKKFTVTNTGLYYNARLEEEKFKRRKFTESRKNNLLPKKPPHMDAHMGDHMAKPMGVHMENENGNINQKWNARPDSTLKLELTDLEIGKATEYVAGIRQVALSPDRVRTYWNSFVANLTGEDWYHTRAALVKHFREWLKKQPFDESKPKPYSVAEQIKAARAKQNP